MHAPGMRLDEQQRLGVEQPLTDEHLVDVCARALLDLTGESEILGRDEARAQQQLGERLAVGHACGSLSPRSHDSSLGQRGTGVRPHKGGATGARSRARPGWILPRNDETPG